MRDLPDWVLKYKTKGTNIIKKNNNYYLYRVHSERRSDKTYPILVTDEYLGVITPDGLKTKKETIDNIIVKEYGLSNYYFNYLNTLNITTDINILISLTLLLAYDDVSIECFNYSYLSVNYEEFNIPNSLDKINKLIQKHKITKLNIKETNRLRNINKICINNKFYDQTNQ